MYAKNGIATERGKRGTAASSTRAMSRTGLLARPETGGMHKVHAALRSS
jgi:hypothetical protein